MKSNINVLTPARNFLSRNKKSSLKINQTLVTETEKMNDEGTEEDEELPAEKSFSSTLPFLGEHARWRDYFNTEELETGVLDT